MRENKSCGNSVYLDAEWSPYDMAERRSRAEAYIKTVKLRRLAASCLRSERILRLLIWSSVLFLCAVALAAAVR